MKEKDKEGVRTPPWLETSEFDYELDPNGQMTGWGRRHGDGTGPQFNELTKKWR